VEPEIPLEAVDSLAGSQFRQGMEGNGMRPTRIELATFGLKDRRSLPLVKAALTTELRAHASRTLTRRRWI
jgi:hypothetical protein